MNDRHFKNFVIGVGLGASGFAFAAVTLPNTFTAGTPIVAAQVNDNFAAIKTALETAGGINDGAIGVGKLSVAGTAADGKVLKAQGGKLTWGDDLAGGGITFGQTVSGASGTGFTVTLTAPIAASGQAALVGRIGPASSYSSVAGVWGDSRSSVGVLGSSDTNRGVSGVSGSGLGVAGNSTSGTGTSGYSDTGTGVAAGSDSGVALEVAGPIKVSTLRSPAFVHIATTANTLLNATCIDNPGTNGKPSAILIITHNFGPNSGSGLVNNSPIGVYYNPAQSNWCIFNEDTSPLRVGNQFNVLVFQQ